VSAAYQGRPAADVTTQLTTMYDRATAAGIAVIAGTIVPFNTATADQNARMQAINDWITSQAKTRKRFLVADTRAATADPKNPDRLAGSPDELHPDIDGYHRMAEVIEPLIRRAL